MSLHSDQDQQSDLQSMEELILRGQHLLSGIHPLGPEQLSSLFAMGGEDASNLVAAIRDLGIPAERETDIITSVTGLIHLAGDGARLWASLGEEEAVGQVEALRAAMSAEEAQQLQMMVDLVVYGGDGGDVGFIDSDTEHDATLAGADESTHREPFDGVHEGAEQSEIVQMLDEGAEAETSAARSFSPDGTDALHMGAENIAGNESLIPPTDESATATSFEQAAEQQEGGNVRSLLVGSGSSQMVSLGHASLGAWTDGNLQSLGALPIESTSLVASRHDVHVESRPNSERNEASQPGENDGEEDAFVHIEKLSNDLVQSVIGHTLGLFHDAPDDRHESAENPNLDEETEEAGVLRRMDSDLLRRRQSADFEVTAFSTLQFASSERREVAGEHSVSDLIEQVLTDFAQNELVELVHDELRTRIENLLVPLRPARAQLEEVDAKLQALEASAADDDEEDSEREEEKREEMRAELQVSHRKCLVAFKTAEMPLTAARRKMLGLWDRSSPTERSSIQSLQCFLRAKLTAQRHAAARATAIATGQRLLPWFQTLFARRRFQHRAHTAAGRIQQAYRGLLARREYMDRVAVSIRDEIVEYIRAGITNSVAEGERARHKEWLIAEATPSAELLQATLRRQLSPSLAALEHKFNVLTTNAQMIHRAMRSMVRTTRYLRGIVTTICVEDALFGTAMDRATTRLYQTAMLRHLQAVFRRKSVMRARAGIVTTASVDLAVTMAFSDSMENMWKYELEEMYKQPLIEFASELLGVYHRRLLDRRELIFKQSLAIACQTMYARRKPSAEFALKLASVFHFRVLFACLSSTRQFENKRRVVINLQRRARSNALIYATRKHRRLVGRLVAIAKSNLCRRFYLHMIRVGDHLVNALSRNETFLPPPEPETPPPEVKKDNENKAPILRRRQPGGQKSNKQPKPGRNQASRGKQASPIVTANSATSVNQPGSAQASTASPMPNRTIRTPHSALSGVQSEASVGSVGAPSKAMRSPHSSHAGIGSEQSRESVANSRARVKIEPLATPSTPPKSQASVLASPAAQFQTSNLKSKHQSRMTSSVEFQLSSVADSRRPSAEGSIMQLPLGGSSESSLEFPAALPQYEIRDDMSALARLALKFIASLAEDEISEDAIHARDDLLEGRSQDQMLLSADGAASVGGASSVPDASNAASIGLVSPMPATSATPLGSVGSAAQLTDLVSVSNVVSTTSDGDIADLDVALGSHEEETDELEYELKNNLARRFAVFCSQLSVDSAEEERCIRWLQEHEMDLIQGCRELESSQLVMFLIASFVRHVERQCWPVSTGELGLEVKKLLSMLEFFLALHNPCMQHAVALLATRDSLSGDGETKTERVGQTVLASLEDVCRAIVRGIANKAEADMDDLLRSVSSAARSCSLESTVTLAWLSERVIALADLMKDFESMDDPSLWITLWSSLVDHCYVSLHILPCTLLQDNEVENFVDRCVETLGHTFQPGEKPFKLYDDLWTIVPFPDDPDQYKYLYKPCIPKGFALNASGIRVPVDPVKEDSTISIFEAVFALSWSFGEDIVARIVPTVSSDLPLGLFGSMTARRRRERVRMWCDMATERCLCALLLHAVKCTEGARTAAACWVLSVLCLLPGRAVTLHSLGALRCMVALVAAADHLPMETAGAAGLALQVLLSDDYVASRVPPDLAAVIARVVKRSNIVALQGAVVNALKQIMQNSTESNEALQELNWLPTRLQALLVEATSGRTKLAADAALTVAALCSSDEAADRVGGAPGIMDGMAALLGQPEPLCVSAALKAFLLLARTPANGIRMMSVPGLHEQIVTTFNSDSLQFFTMATDLLCLLVSNPRACTLTLQHVSVLSKLLKTVLSTNQQTATASMRLIERLATSVEESWVLARDAKETNRDRMEANLINAELSLQFGKNVHALSVVTSMRHSPFPGIPEMSARATRAILRCCSEARSWLLKTKRSVQDLVDGVRSDSHLICTQSLWSIYDLGVPGAQILYKHNAFQELKVLLYTEQDKNVQVAVIRALESFVLGFHRVATPDQDMVEEITARLRSEDEGEQEAAASVIAQMITQDYIDLTVHIHEGRYLPQSDSWGYCDPFIKLKINDQEFQSSTQRNTLSPKWEYTAAFSISDKSEDLVMELWDWDNAGDEFLGHITMSCEELEDLGNEHRRIAIGRELAQKARNIIAEAETKAQAEMEIGKEKEAAILEKGKEEAERLREAMLEEARFLASDPKAEAKRIQGEAAAEAEKLLASVAGQSRVQEYRAAMECERMKKEAKLRAAEIQMVWQQKTEGLSSDDIDDHVEGYKRLAESKWDRAHKTAEKEAQEALMSHVRVATKHKKMAAQESQQLLDLRQGWYVPTDPDDKPLMGKKGTVAGFDENGGLMGDLEAAAASIQMSFEYTVKVNVDRVVWGQEWVLDRCHELLLTAGRESLWVNVLRILRALAEDIEESRAAIGEKEGLLTVLASILEAPDVYACYMEVCQLLQLLAKESSNVLAIVHEPHLMKSLKLLRKWKGTALADLATATTTRLDKAAARIKKQEALSRRNQRNNAAIEKKKAAPTGPPARDEGSLGSPLPARGASPLSPAASPLGGRGARRLPRVPPALSGQGEPSAEPARGGKGNGVGAEASAEAQGAQSPVASAPPSLLAAELAQFQAQFGSNWLGAAGEPDEEGDEDWEEEEEEEEEPDRTDPDAIPDEGELDLSSLDLKEFAVRKRRASMVYA